MRRPGDVIDKEPWDEWTAKAVSLHLQDILAHHGYNARWAMARRPRDGLEELPRTSPPSDKTLPLQTPPHAVLGPS